MFLGLPNIIESPGSYRKSFQESEKIPESAENISEPKSGSEESQDQENEDLHVGLPKHDYKTLSDTPKKKPYAESRTVIKPYDYDKLRKSPPAGFLKTIFKWKLPLELL